MEVSTLRELISLVHEQKKNQLIFNGFSGITVDFFDEMPSGPESANWFEAKKQNGELNDYLKPEFHSLISDLCTILCPIDIGLENDITGYNIIGSERMTWPVKGEGKIRPRGHYWGALHTEGIDKREDIQFFINLTSKGLRVGIFNYLHEDKNRWNKFIQHRLDPLREEIFEELQTVIKGGFNLISTESADYFNHSIGEILVPNSADEMYDFICGKKKFGVMKLIPKEQLYSSNLIEIILDLFDATRGIYEMIQPSKFKKYTRTLTTKEGVQKAFHRLNTRVND